MARLVVKLGSSIVAHDDGALRVDVVGRVCEEVARRRAAGDEMVIVTSGAIARGMYLMRFAVRPTAVEDLQAASAVGQGKLYAVYDGLLRERGVMTAQVLLTFFDMSARTHYLNARQTLRRLLDLGVVPVINENDTTTTDEISFGDNDFLAAQVAVLIGADRLVLLTDTDGLYTGDPRSDAGAALVEEVSDFEALEGMQIGHATSPLGSGGMRSKVVAAEMATAGGIATVIANGLRPDALGRALDGEREGTAFPARESRYSSFKLWLRYAKSPHGTVRRRRRRRPRAARGRHVAAARGDRRRRGALRRRRRDRGRARRPRDREGHLELHGRRAAPGEGHEERRGARSAPAGDGGSRAPGLLRPRVDLDVAWHSPSRPSPTSASRRATPPVSSPGWTPTRATPRCSPSPTRSSPARARSSRPTPPTSSPAVRPG